MATSSVLSPATVRPIPIGLRPTYKILPGQTDLMELPDVNSVGAGSITQAGIVLDLDGNPLIGMTVSAMTKDGHLLKLAENGQAKPWTETDAMGRFQLNQLPSEPLDLAVYKKNRVPGPIHFPAFVELIPAIRQKSKFC